MNSRVERKTVDLSPFPDLVVIYLGMRVNALTGVKTLFGFGPQIKNSVDQKPDGLLLHENFIMSLIPLHLGMRQYWRDFDALEAWARSTSASRVVARLPSVISRHGLLARGLFHAWWHGSGLRRCTGSLGLRTIRAHATCPWTNVLSPHEGQAGR